MCEALPLYRYKTAKLIDSCGKLKQKMEINLKFHVCQGDFPIQQIHLYFFRLIAHRAFLLTYSLIHLHQK